jgi:hypothetical protein
MGDNNAYLIVGGVLLVPISLYSLAHGIVFTIVAILALGLAWCVLFPVYLLIREIVQSVKDAIYLRKP